MVLRKFSLKAKNIRLLLAISLIILFILVFCTFFGKTRTVHGIPDNTYVVINISTYSTSTYSDPFAKSNLYYYSEEGELLGVSPPQNGEYSCLIAETCSGLTCFYKNHTVIVTRDGETELPNSSQTTMHTTKFRPSQVGYLPSVDISFALLNIGQKSSNVPYINILRFVSQEQNYDIIIPYYLTSVAYDPVQNRFLCEISPIMGTSEYIEYVIVFYNEETGQFELDETVNKLHNPDLSDVYFETYNNALAKEYLSYNSEFLVRGNILKQISEVQKTPDDTQSVLIQSIYDLETQELIENKQISSGINKTVYGGMLVGSQDTPFVERDGTLFAFVSPGSVFQITDQPGVEIQEMPYEFENMVPLSCPSYLDFEDRRNFTDVEIKVDDDGRICVLMLNRDMKLQIHQLTNEGFVKIWEGPLPEGLGENIRIANYEILTEGYFLQSRNED